MLLIVAGCRSPQTKVAGRVNALRVEWQTNVAYRADLPRQTLDWPAALAELRAHNFKLKQARIDVTNSQESVRQVFRDLAPTLNLRSGVSRRLKSLSSTGVDDVTLSADSFLNIPGLVSFGPRLYAARLLQMRAETACALAEREQTIELFKLFLAAQEQQENERYLAVQKSTAAAIAEIDPPAGRLLLAGLEVQELAGRKEKETSQQRAADLFGDRSCEWVLVTNGLPELRYDSEPLPLSDIHRVAQLQMRLMAVELEAARAQLTGIKMRYWPELNLFISGPPLYQRAFGRERFWDATSVRASADLFWYVDTRGHVSRQIRQMKRQQELQRERLRQESLALLDQLLFTQNWVESVRDQLQRVEQQLALLRAVPPSQNLSSVRQYAADDHALVQQQRRLQRDLAELYALFWFVDEQAWALQPSTSKTARAEH